MQRPLRDGFRLLGNREREDLWTLNARRRVENFLDYYLRLDCVAAGSMILILQVPRWVNDRKYEIMPPLLSYADV